MEVYVPPDVAGSVAAQLDALAAAAAPFEGLVADYGACLRHNRELEVRVGQLDKEAAELRDEVSALATQVKAFDSSAAQDFATKAESYRQDLARAQTELATVYRDKSRALEDLIAAQRAREAAAAQAAEAKANFDAQVEEVTMLKQRLGELSVALDKESAARQLAATEAESRLSDKALAEERSARLEGENATLMRRLMDLQAQQADKLEAINKMHEEMMEHSRARQMEQAADKQLLGLLKGGLGGRGGSQTQQQQQQQGSGVAGGPPAASGGSGSGGGLQMPMQVLGTLRGVASGALASTLLGRRGSSGEAAAAAAAAANAALSPSAAAAAAAASPRPLPRGTAAATAGSSGGKMAAAAAAAAAAGGGGGAAGAAAEGCGVEFVPGTLKQLMGLPELPAGPVPERSLPAAPAKTFAGAHKGNVTGVAVMRPGHFVCTVGTDRGVLGWDLNTLTPAGTFHGAASTVNDAAFTQDGCRVLGACGDKRILVWSFQSGQPVHTLTGHGGGVTCVTASALDAAVAVSAGEDRCVKVWDLQRGFCTRSLPCPKMPTALTLSLDGTTILTGHLDGSLCLWDMRQDRAGGKPLAELRDSTQTVLSLSPHWGDENVVLTASKDSTLRLWDFRALSITQSLKASGFSIGCVGSMGRGRCTCDISPDGRFVAAGAADGTVFVWDLKPPGTSRRTSTGDTGAPQRRLSQSGSVTGSVTPVTRLVSMKEQVAAVGWSFDGGTLVTTDKSGAVAFWQCTV